MGEYREKKAFKGRVREARVTLTATELQALGAGTTYAKQFGSIPPDAIITHTLLKRGVAFTDGDTGTFAATVGDGTTGNNVMPTGDIDGGTTPVLTAQDALISAGGTFTLNVSSSVNLNTATAGSCEVIVRFIA